MLQTKRFFRVTLKHVQDIAQTKIGLAAPLTDEVLCFLRPTTLDP